MIFRPLSKSALTRSGTLVVIALVLASSSAAIALVFYYSTNPISGNISTSSNQTCDQTLVGMRTFSKTIVWDLASEGDYTTHDLHTATLIKFLFENFSQLSASWISNINGEKNVFTTTMSLLARPFANETGYYQASFTDIEKPQIGSSQSPIVIWFFSNGTQAKIISSNSSISSNELTSYALNDLYPIEQLIQGGILRNQSMPYPSSYHITSSKVQEIGSTIANATVFSATPNYLHWLNTCPDRRGNYTAIVDDVMLIPKTNANISTYFSVSYSHDSYNDASDTFIVDSLIPA